MAKYKYDPEWLKDELNKKLNKKLREAKAMRNRITPQPIMECSEATEARSEAGVIGHKLWSSDDRRIYFPVADTVETLPPDVYEPRITQQGQPFFYRIHFSTEELIRFEDSNIDRVVTEITEFWKRKDRFEEFDFPYRRGILLHGVPGCHAKGTKVILRNGLTKNVEDVAIGDVLLGPDSQDRNVLALCRGAEDMYRITPVKGEPFVVNGNHILSLKRSGHHKKSPSVLNITVNEFMSLSKPFKDRYKLYHCNAVNFKSTTPVDNHLIDPYFLGLWLGDGTSSRAEITTADKEIANYTKKIAKNKNLYVTIGKKSGNLAATYTIVGRNNQNTLLDDLRSFNLINNKHIPRDYLLGSAKTRLALLAGIIDTDGHYASVAWRPSAKYNNKGNYKSYYEITLKLESLANDIAKLARSLGLGANVRSCIKTIKSRNFSGKYWRVSIFGNISQIPVKLKRKQANRGSPNKDPLRTGIKEITALGRGKYYGFILDKDHLYMTDDFIVHHNSGKSCAVKLIINDVISKGGIGLRFDNPAIFIKCMRTLRLVQPETPVVGIMEDIDGILDRSDESVILNMLDGIDGFENIVYLATTNYPEELEDRIKNRPSRFDRRFEIGFPSSSSRKQYIEHLTNKVAYAKEHVDVAGWVKDTHDFTFAHIKELFISVVLFETKYEDALRTLKDMRKNISSDNYETDRRAGFRGSNNGEIRGYIP